MLKVVEPTSLVRLYNKKAQTTKPTNNRNNEDTQETTETTKKKRRKTTRSRKPTEVYTVVGRSELCYFGFSNLSATTRSHLQDALFAAKPATSTPHTHEPYAHEKASLQCNCVYCYHVPRGPATSNNTAPTTEHLRDRSQWDSWSVYGEGSGPSAAAAAAALTRNLPPGSAPYTLRHTLGTPSACNHVYPSSLFSGHRSNSPPPPLSASIGSFL